MFSTSVSLEDWTRVFLFEWFWWGRGLDGGGGINYGPKVSEFLGISIYIYYDDHPPPHFHVVYSGDEAVFLIDHLRVTRGKLPPRVFGLVLEWAFQHRLELGEAWRQAQVYEPLVRIPPLE